MRCYVRPIEPCGTVFRCMRNQAPRTWCSTAGRLDDVQNTPNPGVCQSAIKVCTSPVRSAVRSEECPFLRLLACVRAWRGWMGWRTAGRRCPRAESLTMEVRAARHTPGDGRRVVRCVCDGCACFRRVPFVLWKGVCPGCAEGRCTRGGHDHAAAGGGHPTLHQRAPRL